MARKRRPGLSEVKRAPMSSADAKQEIELRLEKIRELLSHGPAREHLFEALAIASRIYRKRYNNEAWAVALRDILKREQIKVRRGKRATAVAKLCFPGKDATSYNRYAAVIRLARKNRWGKSQVMKELGGKGIEALRRQSQQGVTRGRQFKL